MVAYDAVDSPSWIATLLIWQQPHILYMLELMYKAEENQTFLLSYYELVRETADFMCDFTVYNGIKDCYELKAPLIPAQEEFEPTTVLNPTFEVAYWQFGLKIAIEWGVRLGEKVEAWKEVAEKMAKLPMTDGLYSSHEACPTTYKDFNKDHPSMLGAFGLINVEGIDKTVMKKTLEKVLECWDFNSMWGWDFAMMAMTAARLGCKELAVDILLKDSPKNSYVASGNNYQRLRKDLPLYLPGNGSLLLAVTMMVAGAGEGCALMYGFPDNGQWDIEIENIMGFPY